MFHNRLLQAGLLSLPLLLALLLSASGRRAAFSQAEGEWRTDFERARAEARQKGKPLFVTFR